MAEILLLWLVVMLAIVIAGLVTGISFFLVSKIFHYIDVAGQTHNLSKRIKYYLISFILFSLMVLLVVVVITGILAI